MDVFYVGSRTFAVGQTIPVLAYELPIDAILEILLGIACRYDLLHTRMLIDGRGLSS